ncbi:nonribosomal peptide synthetase MxaA [Crenothrix polyspora]|uniref:Putative MxaA protein n=1 Tax=Crenothrix polyspora TaxID=360316 RepID=A0A1R4H221_9GAMM|nr:nonribosomal peptide synthetase MxaA [Crenothrix polyspora]SJM90304.1 putative MxaA protein [Crenothrix polyspora]
MKILLLFFLVLAGCSNTEHGAVRAFTVHTPRPFGYVLGDEIPQQIILETASDVALQTGALPIKGTINRWLELKQATWEKTEIPDGWRYVIDLNYQVFYVPLEVKMLKIPGFALQLSQQGKISSQPVPDWAFTVAPLRELAVRKDDNGEYMRPDAEPHQIASTNAQIAFGLSASLALAIAGYLAYLYGYFPILNRSNVFKQALRKISRLSKGDIGQILAAVHYAFNQLNGKPLFQVQVADFLSRHPEYAALKVQLEWFFAYSNRYHFGHSLVVIDDDVVRLKNLCQHCRAIERGSR